MKSQDEHRRWRMHIVELITDQDIKERTSFVVRIHSVDDRAGL
ncbi:MAG: hypothetical protein PHD61_01725 [Bacteroidales bacterium]|nr:hypothetical protein [Bacteroidales bacterium]